MTTRGGAPLRAVPARGLVAALAALLLGGAGARAQEVRESEPIPIDTLAFVAAPADTVPILAQRFRESEAAEELARVPTEDRLPRNPRNAAIRAFLIPGWGQFYTGHPLRGIGFAVSEVTFFLLGYQKQQEVLDTRHAISEAREAFLADTTLPEDPATRESLFLLSPAAVELFSNLDFQRERRDDFYAYAAASVIFAAVDAYVAAQLDPLHVGADAARRRAWVALELPLGGPPGRRR